MRSVEDTMFSTSRCAIERKSKQMDDVNSQSLVQRGPRGQCSGDKAICGPAEDRCRSSFVCVTWDKGGKLLGQLSY